MLIPDIAKRFLFVMVFAAPILVLATKPNLDGRTLYSVEVGDSKLWDVSGNQIQTFDLDDLTLRLDYTLSVDVLGKISGRGTAEIKNKASQTWPEGEEISLQPDLLITGSLKKSGSVVRLTLKFKLSGAGFHQLQKADCVGTLNATAEWSANADDVELCLGEISGSFSTKTRGTSRSFKRQFKEEQFIFKLDEDMDGTWEVRLNKIETDAKNKIKGDGFVKLSDDREFKFSVTGNYSTNTDLATFTLTGSKAMTNAGVKLTIVGTCSGDFVAIQKLGGQILGQTIAKPKLSGNFAPANLSGRKLYMEPGPDVYAFAASGNRCVIQSVRPIEAEFEYVYTTTNKATLVVKDLSRTFTNSFTLHYNSPESGVVKKGSEINSFYQR